MIAIAERGAMCNPRDVFYMDKIVVGAAAADIIDINAPVERNIRAVASALHMNSEDVTACILNRPRHTELTQQVRSTGAGSSSSATATRPAPSWPPHRTPASTSPWVSVAPRERPRSLCTTRPRRSHPGQAVVRRRPAETTRPRCPARPRQGADHPRPGHIGQRLLRLHRHHRRRPPRRRPVHLERGDHRVPRPTREERDHPFHPQPTRVVEAAGPCRTGPGESSRLVADAAPSRSSSSWISRTPQPISSTVAPCTPPSASSSTIRRAVLSSPFLR
jgi:hypothetical protein